MASCKFDLPDEFLTKVSRLSTRTDEIMPKVLEAGAEVIERKVRSNLQSAIGRGTKTESRSTGELLAALGTSPARVGKDGNHDVKIGFAEPRRDGSSNAKIANVLEYGKVGQPARPFLKPAVSASKNACVEAMEAKLKQEVDAV